MDSNAQIFLTAAEKCLTSRCGVFWTFLPDGMQNSFAFRETLGYRVGHGNNNPWDLTNNERAIFLCFCAAMAETGDL